MQKILIIQTAYIGDVILATSLIRKIHELNPNSQIDFLLRAGNESLIEDSSKITNIYIWDKKKKYRSLFSIVKRLRVQKYDFTVNIQRFFNSGLFTILSGSKVTVGFDKNPLSFLFTHKITHLIPHKQTPNDFLHEVQRNANLLKPIFQDYSVEKLESLPLELSFSNRDRAYVSDLIKNVNDYLVIAPSSVWFTKQYPKEKWIVFLKELPTNLHIFMIGAPSDKDFIQELVSVNVNVQNMAGKLSLKQSAILMEGALRVFVNDSAPLHLASAVQANTTAIFCSTSTEFGYFPLSKNSVVIEETQGLSCRPCGLHGKKACPLGHFQCALSIDTKDLLETLKFSNS